MRDPAERDASLAVRSGRGNRLRKAVGWYRNHGRLHTGDPVAMAHDAAAAYVHARAEGKDAAIICDRWEIADAINQKLHGHYTDPTTAGVRVARDQEVRVGDIIISRNNDSTITVAPGRAQQRGERIDQVRNGNRWRVAITDPTTGQVAAERLTDQARVIFDGDYLKDHITLGYATTVHSAQGMTVGGPDRAGVCWTVLSERASRAVAYVGMTRARDENHVAIYPATTTEATEVAHELHRGTKYDAAAAFHAILTATSERAQSMHAVAETTDRTLLPTMLAAVLDRNDQRRTDRTHAWSRHVAEERARAKAMQRIITAQRARSRDEGYGLEL